MAGEKQRNAAAHESGDDRFSAGDQGVIRMAIIDTDEDGTIEAVRHNARLTGHVQNAQVMLVAAGIAAFSIVAVATAMLTTML